MAMSPDSEPVVATRKEAPEAAAGKDEEAVDAARRAGAEIETVGEAMEKTLWMAIARFLSGRSLVMLELTSKWFYHLIMDESIWKFACLHDLRVPEPKRVSFKWISLYASAFDGSHSYRFRQQEKHFEWERIGAFSLDSSQALLTRSLSPVEIPEAETMENILESAAYCLLKNIRTGIWIADMHLLCCPICDISSCPESMLMLEARHIELFLNEGFQDGTWEYQVVGAHDIKENTEAASGAIFDVKHLKDSSTSAIFDVKSWVVEPANRITKAMATVRAVAVYADLQIDQGWRLKYHVMRAGADGKVVSMRIGLQLL